MRRRIWLLVLCLYALGGVIDGAHRLNAAKRAGGDPIAPGAIAVAFCAGLFWPLDLVVQPLLASR